MEAAELIKNLEDPGSKLCFKLVHSQIAFLSLFLCVFKRLKAKQMPETSLPIMGSNNGCNNLSYPN